MNTIKSYVIHQPVIHTTTINLHHQGDSRVWLIGKL